MSLYHDMGQLRSKINAVMARRSGSEAADVAKKLIEGRQKSAAEAFSTGKNNSQDAENA